MRERTGLRLSVVLSCIIALALAFMLQPLISKADNDKVVSRTQRIMLERGCEPGDILILDDGIVVQIQEPTKGRNDYRFFLPPSTLDKPEAHPIDIDPDTIRVVLHKRKRSELDTDFDRYLGLYLMVARKADKAKKSSTAEDQNST